MFSFLTQFIANYYHILFFSLFSSDKIFIKINILILVISLISIIIFKKRKKPDGMKIVNHFKIHDKTDKMLSFMFITIYIIIFFLGFFVLRWFNKGMNKNLNEIFNTTIEIIKKKNYMLNILNFLLLFALLILVIILLRITLNFFTKHFVKIHLYYYDYDTYPNFYNKYFILYSNKFSFSNLFNSLMIFLRDYLKIPVHKFIFGFPIEYHLKVIFKKIQYILFFSTIIHDIIYNNYIIENYYKILPFSFIYYWYLKLSLIYDNTDQETYADLALHLLMYSNKNKITIDKEFSNENSYFSWSYENLQLFIFVYLRNNLNGVLLAKAINNDKNYLRYPTHCYYYDNKARKYLFDYYYLSPEKYSLFKKYI